MIDQNTGQPSRIPTGNIGFGIRVDEVWELIDMSIAGKAVALPVSSHRRERLDRSGVYLPFPLNWDGTTILP